MSTQVEFTRRGEYPDVVHLSEVSTLSRTISVPSDLLLDQRLSAPARLIWMIVHHEMLQDKQPISQVSIHRACGLDRKTIAKGLSQLKATGWHPQQRASAQGPWAPRELLFDQRLGVQAKLLYPFLQLTPGYKDRTGQFTYIQLGQVAGVNPRTAKTAIGQLRAAGWIQLAQRNQLAPIKFTLQDPVGDRLQGRLEELKLRLTEAEHKGEAIMQEFLSLIVNNDIFHDNVRLEFLKNPYTDEPLEYDRFYPPDVAFEYNGLQHYGATERYPDVEQAWKQQGRDYIKLGISQRRGITLVTVHREDLSLKTLVSKVTGLLPLRDLRDSEPLLGYVEKVARTHRAGRKLPL